MVRSIVDYYVTKGSAGAIDVSKAFNNFAFLNKLMKRLLPV